MKYKPVTFGADAMVQYISGFSQIYSMYSTLLYSYVPNRHICFTTVYSTVNVLYSCILVQPKFVCGDLDSF